MKAKEEIKKYRDMDIAGLQKELEAASRKGVDTRLSVAAGKLDNSSLVGKTRKNIARIKSIINEKETE